MNVPKLKGKIVESQTTIQDLAEAMKIDRGTLYRRLANDGKDFTLDEILKMIEILHLEISEVVSIFFA